MSPSHEPWLVALSLLLAFQGSYVGLHLARQIETARGIRRRSLITASALSLALGIWTMHFIGMLAAQLPVAVDFLVLPTLLSFLICVLVVGCAVFEVGTRAPTRLRIATAAGFMGAGIVTMHYLGMYALHASLHMTHDPVWVIASVLGGLGASGIALWLGFGEGVRRSIFISAILMALAILAMHYTAMAGMTLHAHEGGVLPQMPALSHGLLAIVVSVVAFVVSGLFLLTLVPEAQEPSTGTTASAIELPRKADGPTPPVPPATAVGGTAGLGQRTLPVEKSGVRRQLEASRIVAVQAQAHYTQLFDGETTWFCPLAISEVEAILDPAVFARVHRSHIVNLDRISALKKAADAGFVAMAARTPYQAPVSRSRRGWLKQRLQERVGLAE